VNIILPKFSNCISSSFNFKIVNFPILKPQILLFNTWKFLTLKVENHLLFSELVYKYNKLGVSTFNSRIPPIKTFSAHFFKFQFQNCWIFNLKTFSFTLQCLKLLKPHLSYFETFNSYVSKFQTMTDYKFQQYS
jgi:hypothetical protein